MLMLGEEDTEEEKRRSGRINSASLAGKCVCGEVQFVSFPAVPVGRTSMRYTFAVASKNTEGFVANGSAKPTRVYGPPGDAATAWMTCELLFQRVIPQ